MASSPQHEPTMEEILASIRKIISEDATDAKPEPMAQAEPAPQMEAEVLELTQEVAPDPEPELAAMPVAAPEPVIARPITPPPQEEVVFQPIQEEPAMSSSAAADNSIFSDKTRSAIDKAFDSLDQLDNEPAPAPRKAAAPMPAPEGDSVQAVFERAVVTAIGPHLDGWMDSRKDELLESVRPVIREWMDEHFPALLEGAVREEVARVVKARGRR